MKLLKIEDAVTVELGKLVDAYPIGTQISFTIMHNQKIPSTGQVIGHDIIVYTASGRAHAYGQLTVQHDQASNRSRYERRRVPISNVVKG